MGGAFNVGLIWRLLLAFVLAVGVPAPAVQAASSGSGSREAQDPAEPVREDGILGLTALRLPRSGKVCTGASMELLFQVSNVSPGLEVPLPVIEAMVNVTDDRGLIRETQTNGAGLVSFTWPAEREGSVRFTVTARKTFYLDAKPLTFSVQVDPCEWVLAVDYREEFAIVSEWDFVIGANVRWRGKIAITSTNGDSGDSEVEIRGGSGTYEFYCSDKIEAPLHWSIDPPVSGTWGLKGDGRLSAGVLTLDVGTTQESYPEMVLLKLTDTTGHYQINYKPPAPYLNGKGFFIEANKLGHLVFPASGGSVTLSSGLSTYFWTDARTAYTLSIMLYPLKQMTGTTGAPVAFTAAIP
jgi:hypothetical protein